MADIEGSDYDDDWSWWTKLLWRFDQFAGPRMQNLLERWQARDDLKAATMFYEGEKMARADFPEFEDFLALYRDRKKFKAYLEDLKIRSRKQSGGAS